MGLTPPIAAVSLLVPEFVNRILELVVAGFDLWLADGCPRWDDLEVSLTAGLVGKIRALIDADDTIPFDVRPEQVHYTEAIYRGEANPRRAKRIDFTVEWGRVRDRSHFRVECKRLSIKTKPDDLIGEYVDEGIARFATGAYGAGIVRAGMIGFVIVGDALSIRSRINTRLARRPHLGKAHSLGAPYQIASLRTAFDSEHARPSSGRVRLTHLFFDVSSMPRLIAQEQVNSTPQPARSAE